MKKLKLIYNPNAGDRTFKNNIDACIQLFQEADFDGHIFRSIVPGDIDDHLKGLVDQDYEVICIVGGDGSINIALNAIINYSLNVRLGIIPAGTANDFATFYKLPTTHAEAAQIICDGKTEAIDVGKVNDKYFINVCAAGLLSNVSQAVNPVVKNTLGKLAYYLKGLEQLPNFNPIKMEIKTSKDCFEEDIYWFTILNSAGTGGFENLSPEAKANDGLLDFIGFKAVPLNELAMVAMKMLTGNDYLKDDRVVFFRDSQIEIKYLGEGEPLTTDIDGELGPDLPIVVKNIHKAIEIFVPMELER